VTSNPLQLTRRAAETEDDSNQNDSKNIKLILAVIHDKLQWNLAIFEPEISYSSFSELVKHHEEVFEGS
jgi:hypothetical protein